MKPQAPLLAAALAVLSAGCSPVDPVQRDASSNSSLKIATWNVEHLAERNGEGCRPRSDADYALLRRHADALDADVVALQEVESRAAAERVFDPRRYDIVMSDRPASGRGGACRGLPGQSIRDQRVGFAVRKGVAFTRNPDIASLGLGNPDLRWGVDITISGQRPLRLLAVHLKAGCNVGRDLNDPDCPILFAQKPVLAAWIDARAGAGEDYAILGDWNRRMNAPGDAFFGALDRPRNAATDLVIAGEGRAASCKARYRDFIDMIVTGAAATRRLVPGSFEEFTYGGEPEAAHPSDHCPVSVKVRFE